ncbi:hypothetical protein ACVWY0_000628 [Arthrobacter sp. UYNi723]
MGGSESNFAIALRRLGTSLTWVGRVGNDSLGELVLRELAAEGIGFPLRDESAPTGLMIKERRTMDQLKVWYYRSGSAGLPAGPGGHPGRADCQRPAAAPHGHHSRAFAGGSPGGAICAGGCPRSQHLVSFDLNYRAALWSADEACDVFRNFIAQADIVFAGDDEAAIAVGKSDDSLELAGRIAALGPGQAVIKRGAAGCAAVMDGVEYAQDQSASTPSTQWGPATLLWQATSRTCWPCPGRIGRYPIYRKSGVRAPRAGRPSPPRAAAGPTAPRFPAPQPVNPATPAGPARCRRTATCASAAPPGDGPCRNRAALS